MNDAAAAERLLGLYVPPHLCAGRTPKSSSSSGGLGATVGGEGTGLMVPSISEKK